MADGVDALFAPAARRTGSRPEASPKPPETAAPSTSARTPANEVAKRLSKQYLETHKLDFNDRITDGFLDMVSEKVLLNRERDERLEMFVEKAVKKLHKASDPVTAMMVMALLVSEFCGRSGLHAAGLQGRFKERVEAERESDGMLLLGSLMGEQGKKKKVLGCCLVRHRALAFKFLADLLQRHYVECTLERNKATMTVWNTVIFDGVSYVLDLMHEPGAMYEAGTQKQEEYIRWLDNGASETHTVTISMRQELAGRVPRPNWHVETSDVVCPRKDEDLLGKGGFGQVFKGTWAGATVAIKVVRDKQPTDYDVLNFILEIALLSRLNHPNVMRFWRGCAEFATGGHRNLLMVTEHIEKGGLSTLLHGHGGPKLPEALTLPQAVWLSLGIARGMQYLHACKVLHLDLKSPNVLIDGDWLPKLCDFGLAKISGIQSAAGFETTLRGVSPIWAPPEMFDDQAESMTEKADVYSFGIVFFEVVSQQLPFQEVDQRQLPRAKYEGVLPKIPREIQDDCAALIKSSCAHKPSARPSMAGIVARIQEIATARGVNLNQVEMPAWHKPDSSGKKKDNEKALDNKQLEQERARLLEQLERARDQRRKVSELHLGRGITGDLNKPLLSAASPGTNGVGNAAGNDKPPPSAPGTNGNSGAAAKAAAPAPDPSSGDEKAPKKACCSVL
mmetsp:Transcript_37618/g.70280  ORF Transcript_37618/g.70280 Transcript_37618/m.70280 type:complete len:676 (+) Transcript_37618:178-2205(+)